MPTGCVRTATAAATVTGRRTVKVTFFVDGGRVKTLTRANGRGGRWTLRLNAHKLGFGTHRIRVTVQFARSSRTKAKAMRVSFNRCDTASVQPKFTG
jgi:hypothetical protein